MSIRSFKHKGLEQLLCAGKAASIGPRYRTRARKILDMLKAATCVDDLAGAAGFHPLGGDRKGEYAMEVNQNYRITFRFDKGDNGDVIDADFEDYH
jgi:proteic killer suppression protein